MRFCTSCGKEIKGDAKFCEFCGAAIDDLKYEVTVENTADADAVFIAEDNHESIEPENTSSNFSLSSIPKKWLIIAAGALVAIIVLIIIIASNSGPNFKKLYKKHCLYTWADLGDDGSYLTVDTNPLDLDDSGLYYSEAYYAIGDINKDLNLPDSLLKDMGATTGADGKQTEEFDKVIVSWKYHPNTGLEVTYKKK